MRSCPLPLRAPVANAVVGALLWTVAPLALDLAPGWGSLEHVFLFLPLALAPLALRLEAGWLLGDGRAVPLLYQWAQRLQPFAAVVLLLSFALPKGTVAGSLAVPWLVWALLLGLGAVPRLWAVNALAYRANVLAAHLFLPVGAVWLLLSQLGTGPRNFSALVVFLAALHFHFSGFTFQLLIAATGKVLNTLRTRWVMVHQVLAAGAIIGIPLIAVGNAAGLPALKFSGVASMCTSALALAFTSTVVALRLRSLAARVVLLVSAFSLASAMLVASVYGVGELAGARTLSIERMVLTHGLLNALGFTLCGFITHLLLQSGTSRSEDANLANTALGNNL